MRISDWSSDVCSSDLYLGSASGVGYLILQAEGTLDVNTVFAGIVVLTVFALLLDGLVTVVEDRLLAWKPKADRKSTTSELQSLMRISYAVFCLKKKTKQKDKLEYKEIRHMFK